MLEPEMTQAKARIGVLEVVSRAKPYGSLV